MSQETANITFYQIEQCGYFAFGQKVPEFGDIESLLNEVTEWSKGKTLIETKLYEPENDTLPVYLFNIQEYGDAWLLTMWNEVPSTRQNVASVKAASTVGNASVVMNKIEKGSIPGIATYFWLHPKQKLFATVRFQHLITGQKPMQVYLESFLDFASGHAVACPQWQDGMEVEVRGYRKALDSEDDVFLNLHPKFRTQLVRQPGKHELIRKKYNLISRVERKTLLELNRPEDLGRWQTAMQWLNIRQPSKRPDNIKIKYRLSTPVTLKDVDSIIEDWNQSTMNRQSDDVGFYLKGETNPYWLSHSLAKGSHELDIERDNDEVVNSMSLLKALHPIKGSLLALTGAQ